MIKRLNNNNLEVAGLIQKIFHQSYAVEAQLLKVDDFPPLKRTLDSYQNSENIFFGYFENETLVGVIECEILDNFIDINSLVVHPNFFRNGIAGGLLNFVLAKFECYSLKVETATNNTPAVDLYIKFGFEPVAYFASDSGINKVAFERISIN
ncbi:GNAT family N-acetyltransferase [Aequorivita xiaoshiensis]|uniref:GNAT family N-acetyltransferase n=1 Tax=Aequorivita xiaoshiensis TaxID=2874476 RepID=A0A9X1QXJ1_9FLAO|nr:GNAT family N-acetyltransferase [Aequorivita xiaoshiensis]MCG2430386.1 GNAT family N-acetyltransferase [Aequorivita xiaoshiensis]